MAAVALVLLAKCAHCEIELLDSVLKIKADRTHTVSGFGLLDLANSCASMCVNGSRGAWETEPKYSHIHRCNFGFGADRDCSCEGEAPSESAALPTPTPSPQCHPLSHGECAAVCECVCEYA